MSYYPPIVSVLISLVSLIFILSTKYGHSLPDVPNARSLHAAPVPRVGGVGLLAGVLSGWMVAVDALPWWLLIPVLGLFAVSLLDDKRGLPVWLRLPTHLVAAVILVFGCGVVSQHGLVLGCLALLLTVWSINLYNFMDGSDGLAGGMAVFGFAGLGMGAYLSQDVTLAMLNFCISAAALGFLMLNFHPARVFMGDSGSIPLGFLVAAMGLWGIQRGSWPPWFPLLLFSPFVVDASVTLVKRTLRGEKITEAHREHYYQRAILMGLGHRKVAIAEYALMLGSGGVALYALSHPFPLLMLVMWGTLYFVLMRVVDVAWKSFKDGSDA